MKIAILSSAHHAIAESSTRKIATVIEYLRTINGIEIMTGGSLGIPGLIVKEAKKRGMKTIAYSPDRNKDQHASRYDNLDLQYFDEVKHFAGFTLRSLAMIQDADAVLVLNGRMGTLSEFTISLEEGKKVGVITNTGGIAHYLETIVEMAQKEFPGQLFFHGDPAVVIDWLVKNHSKTVR